MKPITLSPALKNLKKDAVYGVSFIFLTLIMLSIYTFGQLKPLDSNWLLFLPIFACILIAELLKFTITAKHLTPLEILQEFFIIGILVLSSSTQLILRSPSSFTELFHLNFLTASVFFIIYQISNIYSLQKSGQRIRLISSLIIIIIPFTFGWILALGSKPFTLSLGNILFPSFLSGNEQALIISTRIFIIFIFNVILTNAISLLTRRKTINNAKPYLFILVISALAGFAPLIADMGSGTVTASLPLYSRYIVFIITAMLSMAGLWAVTYLLTGLIMDGIRGIYPEWNNIYSHTITGIKKGMVYSGSFIGIIYGCSILFNSSIINTLHGSFPFLLAGIAGALIYPLIKTIIETFDGSQAFFQRIRYSYKNIILYARGLVIGLGVYYGFTRGLTELPTADRVQFGLIIGILAFAGISLLRDGIYTFRKRGKIQTWKMYFVDMLLGGFIGSALAFYFDASQVAVISQKLKLYCSAGQSSSAYNIYPLISKWGFIELGRYTGGVRLFFNEALAGVIQWSIAAWLFAINRTFLTALLQRDKRHIKHLFSRHGLIDLCEHLIQVMRWGLWMSPIINTCLRLMATATWYNQDGLIRTFLAIFKNASLSSADFQQWSLNVFVGLLAYDAIRILIWLDHMGLRVATLVNLSFLGMDKLDEKFSRFIGKAAAARYIPEGVKRFTTWAPLIIPFYLPRGRFWDFAWTESEKIQQAATGGLIPLIKSLPALQLCTGIMAAVLASSIFFTLKRLLSKRTSSRYKTAAVLNNGLYEVAVKNSGEINSILLNKSYDLTRRSYEQIDPAGRILYLVDDKTKKNDPHRIWPVIGNFPLNGFNAPAIEQTDNRIIISNITNDIKTIIKISLPDTNEPVESWEIDIQNLSKQKRDLKIVPYMEWVLNFAHADRGHTQYNRLFPEMEYISQNNAVIALHRHTKAIGFLASNIKPDGFLTSRYDFIGRAQSIWSPHSLKTMKFNRPTDTSPIPTFDPIGSLLCSITLQPNGSKKIIISMGFASSRNHAIKIIQKSLKPGKNTKQSRLSVKSLSPLIGHGEIIPGTPRPYYKYTDNGTTLQVLTPFTPRPYDHTMSNKPGHILCVTNRGLHTSANKNAQQNRITPDWADTVSRQLPGEAFYLYDQDRDKWYSPTYEPLRDDQAKYITEFSNQGTARFLMSQKDIATELNVFVPPHDPIGIYHLTIKNTGKKELRLRAAAYFQIVLSDNPENGGPLIIKKEKSTGTLFFKNPRNTFRKGIAFSSTNFPEAVLEDNRGKFFKENSKIEHPYMLQSGKPHTQTGGDETPVAAFMSDLSIPAKKEISLFAILGQTETKKQAKKIIKKFSNIKTVQSALRETKKWWSDFINSPKVKVKNQEIDSYLNWLKYQALAERIRARRGFYQSSGAFGFRDQLQDTVNMIWVEPSLARKQLILHASQQFPEGDVFHWFFQLDDGRTGFGSRSHASDNPIWLVWGITEYLRMTGDESILEEMTTYIQSENPLPSLPEGKHGMGFLPFRTTRADTIFNHCMKVLDMVFEKKMGRNGLPLIGTGDWNDGLDEIGSKGKGESVWLGFFLYYTMKEFINVIEKMQGLERKKYYLTKIDQLKDSLENTWREDRYLRAIHDDGTEIGIKGSGIWEIDALTAAWAVMSGINPERGENVFNTALKYLEKKNVILLGWPALREDSSPHLGRSSIYPEGVRENGMYCHGVQWLVKAARIIADNYSQKKDSKKAAKYRDIALRLWMKISPLTHMSTKEIEIYGGQPNKQAADMLTTFDPGRMIWNGYTGAAGWMLRQAYEGILGAELKNNKILLLPIRTAKSSLL